MLEGYVTNLFISYLGRYIKNLNKDAVKVSILKGHILLNNVELTRLALQHFGFPVFVHRGVVGKLKILVPWTSLTSKPCELFIEDVVIVVVPRTAIHWNDAEEEALAKQEKADQISIYDATREAKEEQQKEKEKGFSAKVQQSVFNNMKINISNIIIRYEDSVTRFHQSYYSLIKIKEVTCYPTNENFELTFIEGRPKVAHKQVVCSELTMHVGNVDDISEQISLYPTGAESNEEFREKVLLLSRTANPKDIFLPSSTIKLNVRLLIDKDPTSPKIQGTLSISSDDVVNLSPQQYENLTSIQHYFSHAGILAKARRTRPLVSPKEKPRIWWGHAIFQVIQEIRDKKKRTHLNWDMFLEWKQQKKEYLDLFIRSIKGQQQFTGKPALNAEEQKRLTQMEDEMRFSDIALCRDHAYMILQHRKNNAASPKLKMKEIDNTAILAELIVDELGIEKELPPDYVHTRMETTFPKLAVSLEDDMGKFCEFDVSHLVLQAELATQSSRYDIQIRDLGHMRTDGEGVPFFSFEKTLNPAVRVSQSGQRGVRTVTNIALQPITLSVDRTYLRRVKAFFAPREVSNLSGIDGEDHTNVTLNEAEAKKELRSVLATSNVEKVFEVTSERVKLQLENVTMLWEGIRVSTDFDPKAKHKLIEKSEDAFYGLSTITMRTLQVDCDGNHVIKLDGSTFSVHRLLVGTYSALPLMKIRAISENADFPMPLEATEHMKVKLQEMGGFVSSLMAATKNKKEPQSPTIKGNREQEKVVLHFSTPIMCVGDTDQVRITYRDCHSYMWQRLCDMRTKFTAEMSTEKNCMSGNVVGEWTGVWPNSPLQTEYEADTRINGVMENATLVLNDDLRELMEYHYDLMIVSLFARETFGKRPPSTTIKPISKYVALLKNTHIHFHIPEGHMSIPYSNGEMTFVKEAHQSTFSMKCPCEVGLLRHLKDNDEEEAIFFMELEELTSTLTFEDMKRRTRIRSKEVTARYCPHTTTSSMNFLQTNPNVIRLSSMGLRPFYTREITDAWTPPTSQVSNYLDVAVDNISWVMPEQLSAQYKTQMTNCVVNTVVIEKGNGTLECPDRLRMQCTSDVAIQGERCSYTMKGVSVIVPGKSDAVTDPFHVTIPTVDVKAPSIADFVAESINLSRIQEADKKAHQASDGPSRGFDIKIHATNGNFEITEKTLCIGHASIFMGEDKKVMVIEESFEVARGSTTLAKLEKSAHASATRVVITPEHREVTLDAAKLLVSPQLLELFSSCRQAFRKSHLAAALEEAEKKEQDEGLKKMKPLANITLSSLNTVLATSEFEVQDGSCATEHDAIFVARDIKAAIQGAMVDMKMRDCQCDTKGGASVLKFNDGTGCALTVKAPDDLAEVMVVQLVRKVEVTFLPKVLDNTEKLFAAPEWIEFTKQFQGGQERPIRTEVLSPTILFNPEKQDHTLKVCCTSLRFGANILDFKSATIEAVPHHGEALRIVDDIDAIFEGTDCGKNNVHIDSIQVYLTSETYNLLLQSLSLLRKAKPKNIAGPSKEDIKDAASKVSSLLIRLPMMFLNIDTGATTGVVQLSNVFLESKGDINNFSTGGLEMALDSNPEPLLAIKNGVKAESQRVGDLQKVYVTGSCCDAALEPQSFTILFDFFIPPLRHHLLLRDPSKTKLVSVRDNHKLSSDLTLKRTGNVLHFVSIHHNTILLDLQGHTLRVELSDSLDTDLVLVVDDGMSVEIVNGVIEVPCYEDDMADPELIERAFHGFCVLGEGSFVRCGYGTRYRPYVREVRDSSVNLGNKLEVTMDLEMNVSVTPGGGRMTSSMASPASGSPESSRTHRRFGSNVTDASATDSKSKRTHHRFGSNATDASSSTSLARLGQQSSREEILYSPTAAQRIKVNCPMHCSIQKNSDSTEINGYTERFLVQTEQADGGTRTVLLSESLKVTGLKPKDEVDQVVISMPPIEAKLMNEDITLMEELVKQLNSLSSSKRFRSDQQRKVIDAINGASSWKKGIKSDITKRQALSQPSSPNSPNTASNPNVLSSITVFTAPHISLILAEYSVPLFHFTADDVTLKATKAPTFLSTDFATSVSGEYFDQEHSCFVSFMKKCPLTASTKKSWKLCSNSFAQVGFQSPNMRITPSLVANVSLLKSEFGERSSSNARTMSASPTALIKYRPDSTHIFENRFASAIKIEILSVTHPQTFELTPGGDIGIKLSRKDHGEVIRATFVGDRDTIWEIPISSVQGKSSISMENSSKRLVIRPERGRLRLILLSTLVFRNPLEGFAW